MSGWCRAKPPGTGWSAGPARPGVVVAGRGGPFCSGLPGPGLGPGGGPRRLAPGDGAPVPLRGHRVHAAVPARLRRRDPQPAPAVGLGPDHELAGRRLLFVLPVAHGLHRPSLAADGAGGGGDLGRHRADRLVRRAVRLDGDDRLSEQPVRRAGRHRGRPHPGRGRGEPPLGGASGGGAEPEAAAPGRRPPRPPSRPYPGWLGPGWPPPSGSGWR